MAEGGWQPVEGAPEPTRARLSWLATAMDGAGIDPITIANAAGVGLGVIFDLRKGKDVVFGEAMAVLRAAQKLLPGRVLAIEPPADLLPNRVRALRMAAGLTQRDLAAAVGTTAATVQKLEAGDMRLSDKWREPIARALRVDPMDLGDDDAVHWAMRKMIAQGHFAAPPSDVAGAPLPGLPRDDTMPVYACAEGGPDGALVLTTDVVDRIARPPRLEHVQDAFGIVIVGDSMEPVFEAGDIAFVHPVRPVRAGDYVLLLSGERSDGGNAALVKRLVKSTATDWTVRQMNPERRFDLPRKAWPRALKIEGKMFG